jgi:ATP-dependent phosphoenolpyruvate carboxykinase
VLENVVFDERTREVDYSDKSVTGKLINIPKLNTVFEHSSHHTLTMLIDYSL